MENPLHPSAGEPRLERRSRQRSRIVATAAVVTTVASLSTMLAAVPAAALPTPDLGPVAGGTAVDLAGSDYGFVDAAVGMYVSFAITADGRIFSNGMSTDNGMLGTGSTAWTFAVVSGTLPPGLELDPATGVISGTPTRAGSTRRTFGLGARGELP
jgi:hypothetical protein